MTPQLQRRVLATLARVEGDLWSLSQKAGDVKEWNKGGAGYRASLAIRALLDELKEEWGR